MTAAGTLTSSSVAFGGTGMTWVWPKRPNVTDTSEFSRRCLTVADWLRHWLDSIAAMKVRPGTLYGYRLTVEGRIIPAIGHLRLVRLQPEHVEDFYRDLMRPRTVRDPTTPRDGSSRPRLSTRTTARIHHRHSVRVFTSAPAR